MPAELSPELFDKAFRRATCLTSGAPERWSDRAVRGQSDEQLAESIAYELGEITEEMRGDFNIACARVGLRIWISRGLVNRHKDKPAFKGADTIAKCREFYGIRLPGARTAPAKAAAPVQLSFF